MFPSHFDRWMIPADTRIQTGLNLLSIISIEDIGLIDTWPSATFSNSRKRFRVSSFNPAWIREVNSTAELWAHRWSPDGKQPWMNRWSQMDPIFEVVLLGSFLGTMTLQMTLAISCICFFMFVMTHSNFNHLYVYWQSMVYRQCQLSTVLRFAVDLLTRAAEMFLGWKQ